MYKPGITGFIPTKEQKFCLGVIIVQMRLDSSSFNVVLLETKQLKYLLKKIILWLMQIEYKIRSHPTLLK